MPKIGSRGIQKGEIRLGINLWDIDHINPFIRDIALKGKIDTNAKPILIDKHRPDETCVPFTCDLLNAALTLDILRQEQQNTNDPPIRAYIYRRVWSRLPNAAVLTLVDNGKTLLSPEVFREPQDTEPLPLIAPPQNI